MTDKPKVIRCPRCRARPTSYIEVWSGHSISFEADADGVAAQIGYMDDGEPIYVTAQCDCGHNWRLRGVLQITDIRQQVEGHRID